MSDVAFSACPTAPKWPKKSVDAHSITLWTAQRISLAKVRGSNLGPSVWSLHVLHVSGNVSSRCTGVLPLADMRLR